MPCLRRTVLKVSDSPCIVTKSLVCDFVWFTNAVFYCFLECLFVRVMESQLGNMVLHIWDFPIASWNFLFADNDKKHILRFPFTLYIYAFHFKCKIILFVLSLKLFSKKWVFLISVKVIEPQTRRTSFMQRKTFSFCYRLAIVFKLIPFNSSISKQTTVVVPNSKVKKRVCLRHAGHQLFYEIEWVMTIIESIISLAYCQYFYYLIRHIIGTFLKYLF